MSDTLFAGAATRIINPPIGIGKIGGRLFGDPIQAIESDLRASALVFGNGETRVAILAVDQCTLETVWANPLRARIAAALDVPVSHVLINESHDHSTPALPGYWGESFEPEFKQAYQTKLENALIAVAQEAAENLQPARIGTGWGESDIGVYRREFRGGQDVLGEVPDHPTDSSVGVIRVDDLDGKPIAIVFRYSCHPVTVGGRSMVSSSDYPGAARDLVEKNLGGVAMFLQGCGGNINPRVGIGWEIDCRETKNRVGMELGGEVLKVAAKIRTSTKAGERRVLGNIPNILFRPWEPVEDASCTYLGAVEKHVALEYIELPSLAEAEALEQYWEKTLAEREANNVPIWEIRFAVLHLRWMRNMVAAIKQGHPTFDLDLQAIRVNDIVITGMNVETFFETGLSIRAGSLFPQTFPLGYSNGAVAYLPRAQDYPPGGWKMDGTYAVPDMLPQGFPSLITMLHPEAEQRALAGTLDLIQQLAA